MKFREGWDRKEAELNVLAADEWVCLGAGDGMFPIRRIRRVHLVGQGKK